MITVRVFTNFDVPNFIRLFGESESSLEQDGIRVEVNKSGFADFVVVLNFARGIKWSLSPQSRVFKVLQEPEIHGKLSHRFTHQHSSLYSRVFTHSPNPTDKRQKESLGHLGTLVDWPSNWALNEIRKKHVVSIVSSRLKVLPGHKDRSNFIEKLLSDRPDLESHTFGKGRTNELTEKIDGLKDYMFSVAIENQSANSYVTEKFVDCILSGTVPLYFGASNISQYFPQGSYIWLPIHNYEACLKIIDDLSKEEYDRRLLDLKSAYDKLVSEYGLGKLIRTIILDENDTKLGRRLILLSRFDSLVDAVFRIGAWFFKFMRGGLWRSI